MKEEKVWSRFVKVFAVASLITEREERGCTIYEIMDMLGVNNRSSAFNVLETLDEMSEQAFNDQCTGANPRYPLIAELKEIYLKAYYGK